MSMQLINLYLTQNVVKKISRILFEEKIYPTQEEFKRATEDLFKEEHPEFLRKNKSNKWVIFYEKYISQSVSLPFIKVTKYYETLRIM